jgi:4-hydroxy-2-oxoheptanedioate aldolase
MRESKVLKKLKAGESVCCLKINLSNVQVAEIAAMSGFDCLWLDMEHVAQDWSVIYSQNLAAKVYDTDVMVRVSRGGYSDYVKPFELDATGIMVPHVMDAEDARKIIRMTRFHPYGRRPLDGGNSDGAYTALDFDEYIKHSNEQRFTVLQIEDPEPMNELEAIAALDGYDMLFFGPGDFSQGIGFPGQWEHPELLKARELVATTARKYGKFAGTTGSLANLDELTGLGYQFVGIGADVIGLTGYCKSLQEGFHSNLQLKKEQGW